MTGRLSLTEALRIERLTRLARSPVIHLRVLILIVFLRIICSVCGSKRTGGRVFHIGHGGKGIRQRFLRTSHFTNLILKQLDLCFCKSCIFIFFTLAIYELQQQYQPMFAITW